MQTLCQNIFFLYTFVVTFYRFGMSYCRVLVNKMQYWHIVVDEEDGLG